ncbi:MAG: ring,2-phenylacetyl-CoA epoxidase subunit PaaD [Chloroflexia bacterium]|jgi:ring-1,2-phenylacetyl-CoA epoxidase subunit PaaD|nr:ring,2-phenylacetyl-CoA epoxidase subunit PaaD [Chloroflexia bacterium]
MTVIQQNVTEESVREALLDVMDPEIPNLSIVDLGIVRNVTVGDSAIEVELLPTFVGCPALDVMKESVQERLHELAPELDINVKVTLEETWTTDRISERGREVLKSSGFAPPQRTLQGKLNLVQLMPVAECPYCGSRRTVMENAFGPTLCRAIYYCTSCRQPFEQFKQV